MNRRRLLFIGIAALAVGSLVSLKVYRMLQAHSGPAKDFADVLVAAHDIPVGAKIEDRDLKVAKLPPEDQPLMFSTPRVVQSVAGSYCPSQRGILFCPTN